jgi:hypothetical protein
LRDEKLEACEASKKRGTRRTVSLLRCVIFDLEVD